MRVGRVSCEGVKVGTVDGGLSDAGCADSTGKSCLCGESGAAGSGAECGSVLAGATSTTVAADIPPKWPKWLVEFSGSVRSNERPAFDEGAWTEENKLDSGPAPVSAIIIEVPNERSAVAGGAAAEAGAMA